MNRYHYIAKCWEGIPDNEKQLLKKWSKMGHLQPSKLSREVKSKKSAKRLSFSLNIFECNLNAVQHNFLNNVSHLETLLHFGSAGKLLSNYKNSGHQIRKKLT